MLDVLFIKREWFIYSGCVMVCMDKINYPYFYNHLTLLVTIDWRDSSVCTTARLTTLNMERRADLKYFFFVEL